MGGPAQQSWEVEMRRCEWQTALACGSPAGLGKLRSDKEWDARQGPHRPSAGLGPQEPCNVLVATPGRKETLGEEN